MEDYVHRIGRTGRAGRRGHAAAGRNPTQRSVRSWFEGGGGDYVSNQPLFPRDQMITYAESLCAFPFGVRLAGFKVRPKLVCGQIVIDSLHNCFLRHGRSGNQTLPRHITLPREYPPSTQSHVLMFHRVNPKTRFACYCA